MRKLSSIEKFTKISHSQLVLRNILVITVLIMCCSTTPTLATVEPSYHVNSLNVYEVATNRNFKVKIDGNTYYLRIGRDNPEEIGIDREKEMEHYLVAESIGLAPKHHNYHLESGLLITEFIVDGEVSEELIRNHNALDRIIDKLSQLHHLPYSRSSTAEKTVFTINQELLSQIAEFLDSETLKKWIKLKESFQSNYYEEIPLGLCHADLFRGNILIPNQSNVYFIDWEYSYYGYVIDDIGKLCSANWLSDETKRHVSKKYWKRDDEELYKKLEQNVFMQQFNFYLWCHIQAKKCPENASSYLSLAKLAEASLNNYY